MGLHTSETLQDGFDFAVPGLQNVDAAYWVKSLMERGVVDPFVESASNNLDCSLELVIKTNITSLLTCALTCKAMWTTPEMNQQFIKKVTALWRATRWVHSDEKATSCTLRQLLQARAKCRWDAMRKGWAKSGVNTWPAWAADHLLDHEKSLCLKQLDRALAAEEQTTNISLGHKAGREPRGKKPHRDNGCGRPMSSETRNFRRALVLLENRDRKERWAQSDHHVWKKEVVTKIAGSPIHHQTRTRCFEHMEKLGGFYARVLQWEKSGGPVPEPQALGSSHR
ncbi:uncharacterized protein BCR38DRAFT_411834 [Pseudomassariella vexata]|uniref:Uncharacterized protein n=1 Tax=Pseudomassariella vexata TaxID=1141098 RepID=A0A1Y2DN91_9PEZI|nr:uncharacterized protein BCR38DRAFT_411834 [Pseudomassariella vexata]ORY60710.1 hypothetical protein BCR38DRAFT_411834 [Pseudomassariella vexata]